MPYSSVVDRVRSEFIEMPGLELTLPQAVRLWSLGMDDCRSVIDALVEAGFLRWTVRGTVIRTGRSAPLDSERHLSHIPVRVLAGRDKSVGSGSGE